MIWTLVKTGSLDQNKGHMRSIALKRKDIMSASKIYPVLDHIQARAQIKGRDAYQ